MPGIAHRNEQFTKFSSNPSKSLSLNDFWSNNRGDVSYNQLHKFWTELSLQARQELLRIDKQSLIEQARKNMYCSRCNGLLLEGFLQIVMYGKSLQQEGAGAQLPYNTLGGLKKQNNGGSSVIKGCQDEIQDPSIHPWGGLTTTREGSLTLMNCYLYSKSLKGLQIVFDGARARERERELLYPDACGGAGRGWISQGIVSYGRGHGTRETCALHTARLSCDTLVDFWSALGEETRFSLLRMKEEDFMERLMFRFDSKKFCRDCRRNVIREFKELKELNRIRRETRCSSWYCVADSAFQYEVSDDSIHADWHQTFPDISSKTYRHFEWAVGSSEGKSDILEFRSVGLNCHAEASNVDLGRFSACFITLRAWRKDGRCTELCVKAYSLNGQQCVHCRLIVGGGYVTITKGESIRRFFEHAEEAEEEEDDDSVDNDGNELDGECSRPQKHAKSPELAREFLLDAATVIFKEQVEKAFREGTARQNAHSIFVCLALKLLEERVHVACKEIITLEKQMKLLEEEEKEKREEEERKERRRAKEREKKLRRKGRLKGKDKDREIICSESNDILASSEISKDELAAGADLAENNLISSRNSVDESDDANLLKYDSPINQDKEFSSENDTLRTQHLSDADCDEKNSHTNDDTGPQSTVEQSMLSHQRPRCRKEFQLDDMPIKWSDRRRYSIVSDNGAMVGKTESRNHGESFLTPSRVVNGLHRQSRIAVPSKSNGRNVSSKYGEKFYSSKYRLNERCDIHSCSCCPNNEYKTRVDQHSPVTRVSWESKPASQSESAKQFYRGSKYNQVDYMHENNGRPKSKIILGNYPSRDLYQSKKVWEPMESLKKYHPSNSDSDIILRSTKVHEAQPDLVKSSIGGNVDSGENDDEDCNLKNSSRMDAGCQKDFQIKVQGSCSSKEIASEEPEICPTRDSVLNNSSDPTQSSTFSSDNCSSCLSEGDNYTSSSNQENQESSTTSDSEDVSQQSDVRDDSTCMENVLSDCHEVSMDNKQNTNGESLSRSSLIGPYFDGTRSNASGDFVEISQNFDYGFSTTNVLSQPQSLLPPMSNPNIQFPTFQSPSTMGYFHQNLVSWPAAPTNGLMPFPHPNHYLYASPLGYGLNEDPRFCLQYGSLQQPAPLFNPAIPVYQPVARANVLNSEESTRVSKPASLQEHISGSIAEGAVSSGNNLKKPAFNGEVKHDRSVKSQENNSEFSLFHFGGPVALSTGCKSALASSNGDAVGDFSLKCSVDHAEKVHTCNKKDTATMEEYNLFATSNNLRFSIF